MQWICRDCYTSLKGFTLCSLEGSNDGALDHWQKLGAGLHRIRHARTCLFCADGSTGIHLAYWTPQQWTWERAAAMGV